MTGKEHNCTRRAVLGAAFAMPALACANDPVKAAADVKKWGRALVAFRRTEAEMNAFDRQSRAAGATGVAFDEQWALDERFGDYLSAFHSRLRLLLRTPAPDLGALALKIALIVDHEVATLSGGERCLAVLKTDAWKLAS